jgi:dihydrofolate reductase
VAASLDGFIAGPDGDHDWILPDPEIDFAGLWAQFDTLVMGRKTYEVARARRGSLSGGSQRWIVVSSTLNPADHPEVEVVSGNIAGLVAQMKAETGKDIWLSGGGVIFRTLLDAGLVDSVEVMVMPVLLGSGTPLLQPGGRASLRLEQSRTLPSGIVLLNYAARP